MRNKIRIALGRKFGYGSILPVWARIVMFILYPLPIRCWFNLDLFDVGTMSYKLEGINITREFLMALKFKSRNWYRVTGVHDGYVHTECRNEFDVRPENESCDECCCNADATTYALWRVWRKGEDLPTTRVMGKKCDKHKPEWLK